MAAPMHEPKGPSIALPISLLTLCCLFWGFSFPAMQIAASHFENTLDNANISHGQIASRSIFNAARFAFASVAFLILTFPRHRHYSRADIVGGLAVGLTFCLGIILQLMGLQYTLPSTSSFLTALSVIFAPLAQAILLRRPLGIWTILAVITALIGMLILNQSNPDAHTTTTIAQKPPIPHLGEMLTILASLLFTAQILSLDHFGQKADPTRLTFIMLLSTCITSLLIGLSLGGQKFLHPQILSSLAHDKAFLVLFAGLFLISSAIAQYLMNRYQPQ